jgi:phosphoglycerol transferase
MWIYQGRLPCSLRPAPGARGHAARRWAVALVVAVLQAGGGIYYAFFAEYFLLVAGAVASLQRRKVQPLLTAGILMTVTFGAVAVNLLPSITYWKTHGRNPAVAARAARETEWYAVRLTPMLLPIAGHRNAALAGIRERYQQQMQHHYEVHTATLGCVASVGFLVLLGVLCRRRVSPLLKGLSLLNIFGFLCGTTGGLGMLFSLLVTPQMRSQNRICVYLSFLALAAIALLLQSVWRRAATTRPSQGLFCGALALLVWFGLWDQHPRSSRPDYEAIRREWSQDAQFVAEIEASLPPGAMIFQLPYTKFPEAPGVCQHHAYYAMRFYLHSRALRWSSGAVMGRAGDQWQEQVSSLPLEEQLEAIAAAGFQGIQVSRRGYPDQAAQLEARLRERLGMTPIVSPNDRDSFFRLDPAMSSNLKAASRPLPDAR